MATRLKQEAAFEVVPLTPAIGAEIRGLDLRHELDGATRLALRRAWAERSVLVFRGQDLAEADQFRFAAIFGPIADRVQPPVERRAWRADPHKRMQLVTDRLDMEGRPLGSLGHGEMWFHTDKCYVERPHRGSFLYSVEIPSTGGNTRFASLYRAYDRIPDALKRRLGGRKVLQVYDYGKTAPADLDAYDLNTLLHCWQPLFVTNPDSGKRAVYVSRLMSLAVEGLDKAESRAALDRLCDLVEAPDNIYEHVWRVGDLVMWDNLSCVHARTDWPRGEHRLLRRCTIQGGRLS
jgi:taurine dioxygenase